MSEKDMSDKELRDRLTLAFAKAISEMEGFCLTEADAQKRKVRWPTIAQRLYNPGNLRRWGSFPIQDGYAKFPECKVDDCRCPDHPAEEGFRALRKQVTRNVFDRRLSFREFFAGQRDADGVVLPNGYPGYAPSADSNYPVKYAEYVLKRVKEQFTDRKLNTLTIESPVTLVVA